MNLSHTLAEFVANTTYEMIPAEVIAVQKKSIMDAVAVTLGAGTLGDGCRQMVKIADALAAGGAQEATVIGFDRKMPMAWAAFANASMAHSLDFGDTHQKSTAHSNSSSFPAALAVAEQMGGVDGRQFLTALVVGSEVAIRIALAADVNTMDYGFYPPTIYASFGATAAVAKLMGLNAEQIVSAFSFNLCQTTCSSELSNNPRTVIRSVREAFAARNAIVSCCMAREGLIGFDAPLEGAQGLYHALVRDQYSPERALAGLGTDFEAGKLSFKAWPCCFGCHSTITATLQLMRQYDLSADDILHAQVHIGAQNRVLFEPPEQRQNPETAIIAKFSIPYNLALAAIEGDVNLNSYTPEKLHDPALRALAAKVDYTYVEQWQRGQETNTRLVLDTVKGSFETFVTAPFGTTENPMSDETFDLKFDSCAANAICSRSPAALAELKAVIRRTETLTDVRELAALL